MHFMLFDKFFDYPFDGQGIISKQKRIKRYFLERCDSFIEIKIAILGGSTTFNIRNILELFLLRKGIKPVFFESDYNRYYEDAVFGYEKLKAFEPDVAIIHTTSRNIQNFPDLEDSEAIINGKLERELLRYQQIWDSLRRHCHCAIVQNNFELTRHRGLGNLDFSVPNGKTNFIMRLNLAFAAQSRNISQLYINDINYLAGWLGLAKWHDSRLWHSAKYAMSFDAMPLLAHNIASIVCAIYGKTQKVLVLDLDNTLWGGVIGDDGADGIKIGQETPLAAAYYDIQEYVKYLRKRGVVLSISSKNELTNALKGFERADSVLKSNDFQVHKINWAPKPENIAQIAEELNVGLDSLVFIDDNPAEREMVKTQMPLVNVPAMGCHVEDFIDHIDKGGWFEPVNLLSEDLKKNEYYEKNKERDSLRNESANFDEFLKSLKMTAEIDFFSKPYFERIAQLINKTNQFNLTTRRYSIAEVESVATDAGYIALYGKLSDKYGDNGLISVLIGQIQAKSLEIQAWLMSCRVLQRGFENAMMDRLLEECQRRGINRIVGTYLKTNRNAMVQDHYQKMGFLKAKNQGNACIEWVYLVGRSIKKKNEFIRVVRPKKK
jgi:FkbH-like protein